MTTVLTAILTACSDGYAERKLSEAESLVIEHPDSTIVILTYMDTTRMSEFQIARQELLFLYTQLIYGNPIPVDSTGIDAGDRTFTGALNSDEIKWLIVKSAEAKRNVNPVARIELLKDAEFLAIRNEDKTDLGIIYLFLSNVYEQGFNGLVSKYYADKALAIFNELSWTEKARDARMAIVAAYCVRRDYKSALDSLRAMEPEVMANAHDSYKIYFLDQLARHYDGDGQTERAIGIWHSIYDGQDISSNTLAHWAHAYCNINKLDSAYILIQQANNLPHNNSDEYLCRNVEYGILEKMGRRHELARIDSLRELAANGTMADRQLEESSLAINLIYDSATREAWIEATEARNRTNAAIFIAILTALTGIATFIILKKRNRMLRLEHENDLLKFHAMQENMFESDRRNEKISAKISELFHTRFKLIDGLATTYFECKDTPHEQKRIYSEVKNALSNFSSKETLSELTDIVDGYNGDLMEKFKSDFPKLPPSQLRLVLYLFCGFSLQSISIFTGTEIRNIYVYKSRLKSLISKSASPMKAEYLKYFE